MQTGATDKGMKTKAVAGMKASDKARVVTMRDTSRTREECPGRLAPKIRAMAGNTLSVANLVQSLTGKWAAPMTADNRMPWEATTTATEASKARVRVIMGAKTNLMVSLITSLATATNSGREGTIAAVTRASKELTTISTRAEVATETRATTTTVNPQAGTKNRILPGPTSSKGSKGIFTDGGPATEVVVTSRTEWAIGASQVAMAKTPASVEQALPLPTQTAMKIKTNTINMEARITRTEIMGT